MDHTYQSTMLMPASYAVLSEEEMTYLEGGAYSFNVGDHTVTFHPEVLAYYAGNIVVNGLYLLGEGAVQYAFRTVTNGLSDGLTLGGIAAHDWNKKNGWSKAATVGMGALGGFYLYVQVLGMTKSIQNLVSAITGSSSTSFNADASSQSAENGLLTA